MTIIFILIILGFIFWPLIKAGFRMWTQMRSMQRFMQDPLAEMQRRAQQEQQRQTRKARRTAASNPDYYAQGAQIRKKKIPADVGEYVAFTEIKGQTSDSCNVPPVVTAEQQVVDIEWEDIPESK